MLGVPAIRLVFDLDTLKSTTKKHSEADSTFCQTRSRGRCFATPIFISGPKRIAYVWGDLILVWKPSIGAHLLNEYKMAKYYLHSLVNSPLPDIIFRIVFQNDFCIAGVRTEHEFRVPKVYELFKKFTHKHQIMNLWTTVPFSNCIHFYDSNTVRQHVYQNVKTHGWISLANLFLFPSVFVTFRKQSLRWIGVLYILENQYRNNVIVRQLCYCNH